MFLFPPISTIKRGSVLIISMVMLAVFSLLAVGIYRISSAKIALARKIDELILSKQAAFAMAEVTLRNIQEDNSSYHTLYELRTPREKIFNLAKVSYYFIDEESKINVNKATCKTLEKFEALDEDDARNIYESILKPYCLKEELLLVEDMDVEKYNKIKDYLTVYGNGAVNINTADREVLVALGMRESLVDDIVSFRMGFDAQELTEDDNYFENTNEIIEKLNEYCGLFQEDKEKLQELISTHLIDTKSSNFKMHLEVKVKNHLAKKYDIIINKNGIVEWREE